MSTYKYTPQNIQIFSHPFPFLFYSFGRNSSKYFHKPQNPERKLRKCFTLLKMTRISLISKREMPEPTKELKIRLNFATYSAYVRTMPARNTWLAAIHAHRRRSDEVVVRVVETCLLAVVAVERPHGRRCGRSNHRRIVRRSGDCGSIYF